MNIPYEMPPRESPLIRITLAKLRRTLSGLIKLISPPAPTHMYGTPERLFYPVYIGDIFRIIHQTIIKAAYYEAYNDTATQRQYDILASMLADYIIVWSYYHPSHGRNPNAVSNCLNWVPRFAKFAVARARRISLGRMRQTELSLESCRSTDLIRRNHS